MKVGFLCGSHRIGSESGKITRFTLTEWKRLFPQDQTYLLDLAGNPLPLWDDGVWDNTEQWQKVWGPISKELASCDAFVIVTPEWAGMAPGGLKNVLHLCGKHELAHKPAMLIGVSDTTGGAYPIAELRMTSGKNTRICYIPDHVIVRYSKKVLNGAESENDEDKYVRGRIDYGLKVLHAYGEAFQRIRTSGVIDLKLYPNGM